MSLLLAMLLMGQVYEGPAGAEPPPESQPPRPLDPDLIPLKRIAAPIDAVKLAVADLASYYSDDRHLRVRLVDQDAGLVPEEL